MDAKEKLKDILDEFVYDEWYGNEDIAEKLISNGVTVQECKLGDKKTNADRLRSMSDEELADFLEGINACSNCVKRWNSCFPHWDALEWLQQPAEEV